MLGSKRFQSNMKETKKLQAMVNRSDPKIKLGELYNFKEFRCVFVKGEDDKFKDTGKVACIHCHRLLSKTPGGHFNRHLRKSCRKLGKTIENPTQEDRENNSKRFTDLQVTELSKAMVKFCLSSGESYEHMASDAMRSLIVNLANLSNDGYGVEAMNQLPSKETIQKMCEEATRN